VNSKLTEIDTNLEFLQFYDTYFTIS